MSALVECPDCGALVPDLLMRWQKQHAPDCPRCAPRPRRARFVVPWNFDRTGKATITIEIDPRGGAQLVVRPYRRRLVVRADLADVAQKLVEKHLRLAILAKRKTRRSRR